MTMLVPAVRYPASRFETQTWVDLRDPSEQARLTPAAVRGAARLGEAWGLTVAQVCTLLGDVSPSTWHAWVRTPPKTLGVDRLTRASYLMGIYAADPRTDKLDLGMVLEQRAQAASHDRVVIDQEHGDRHG